MTILWPVNVPYAPRVETLRVFEPFRPPLMTDMEEAVRRRPASTLPLAKLSFDLLLAAAEFVSFKTFVRDTLVQGTLSFQMPIWTGTAFEAKSCSFSQQYTAAETGGGYQVVSVGLEVEDY